MKMQKKKMMNMQVVNNWKWRFNGNNMKGPGLVCLVGLLLVSAAVLFVYNYGTATGKQDLHHLIEGESLASDGTETEPWEISTNLWSIVAAGQPRWHNRCRHSKCPKVNDIQLQNNNNNSNPHLISNKNNNNNTSSSSNCPAYFTSIHQYLDPWKSTKISKELLEHSRLYQASFTVIIKSGKLYVHGLGNCFQTRAVFTIWGILQLLRHYPGMVPDLELVFGCGDLPAVPSSTFSDNNVTSSNANFEPHEHQPPPVFRYCTTPQHLDIPFPDWSFWGWPEVNIKPWDLEREEIQQASKSIPWVKRIAKAFWKGNIFMGEGTRMELMKCNGDTADIQTQDWDKEVKGGFKRSKLSKQCKHRYKVYVEGIGWSVSLKYILACDSQVLMVEPKYLEFFTKGLVEGRHYLPIPPNNLCQSIASAVRWGNDHIEEVMDVGKAGSEFVRLDLSMKHVYDYMLHLLQQYSMLLDFDPQPSDQYIELCVDAFLCVAPPSEIHHYQGSMVREPSSSPPCSLWPPSSINR